MGWVKLDRQIFDHWLWQEKPFSIGQAWVDLILLASYEDGVQYYKGDLIERKRGEVCASLKWLASRWGWSTGKVSRFLNVLQKNKMVTQKRNANGTVLSLENYSRFQDARNANETLTERSRNADETLTKTLKNIKKGKEGKEYLSLEVVTDEEAEQALESLRERNRRRKEKQQ